jgi:glycosyltransferase involved in cell wall biosynthesis
MKTTALPARAPRILIVAYDFPPHAAIGTMRTLRLVRHLADAGWDVTVLTGDPRTYLASTPVDMALNDRVPPSVRIVRARAWRGISWLATLLRPARRQPAAPGERSARVTGSGRAPRSGLSARVIRLIDAVTRIPDRESGWLIPAVIRGVIAARSRRPDILYTSAPPWTGQVVAWLLSLIVRAPWLADFRDPWARAPWRDDQHPLITAAARALERRVVTRADAIQFVTAANRDEFAQHYGPVAARKFHVVMNGCDAGEFDAVPPRPAGAGDVFVLLHAGAFYGQRSPVPLLNATAAAIQAGAIDRRRFRLELVGKATLTGVQLEDVIRQLGIGDVVTCVPWIPRAKVLQRMRAASALLLIQPAHSVSIPGKLYEYLAAGRPIFALIDEGETADLIRAADLGVVVPPGTEAAIQRSLVDLINSPAHRWSPAAPALYDGSLRAAETTRLIEQLAVPARHAATETQEVPQCRT